MAAIGLFFFFGNVVIFNEVLSNQEPAYVEPAAHDIAVVLGGYADHNAHGADIEFFSSVDRINVALALYKKGLVKKLLISSGAHPEGHPEWNEATLTAHWLMDCGVQAEDLILEERSINTHQNALFSKEILDSIRHQGPVLLITTATHMRRAEACFLKQGIKVETVAVDHHSSKLPYGFWDYLIPSMRNVIDWEVIIKEWVGLLVYRIQGYV